MPETRRCSWPQGDLMLDYHDHEWGRPCHDDRFAALNERTLPDCPTSRPVEDEDI